MKSFVAPDMRSALRMVREALGDDAVILSNRRVAAGIELLAAADMPPAPPRIPAAAAPVEAIAAAPISAAAASVAPVARAAAPQPASIASEYPEPAVARSIPGDNGWWQMQQELRSMRDLIEQQYSTFSWQNYRAAQPAQAAMWRRLQRLGLDAATARELLDPEPGAQPLDLRNPKLAWQQLMARLSARLPVLGDDPVAGGGVFAFIGPTGAGKTTTIGKLAARHVLQHGNADIALISTDSYRIGAHEQLRTLGRILNVPCKVTGAGRDLDSILYEVRHCRLVLIDTAGLNARAPELRAQLAGLDALGERVRCLQVLAVNAQQQVLAAAQRSYRTGNMCGCIFTKIDEAGSLGEALGLLLRGDLPLAYMAEGQAIPGDIAVAAARQLVTRAIGLAQHAECDEERLAGDFAGAQRQAGRGREKAVSV